MNNRERKESSFISAVVYVSDDTENTIGFIDDLTDALISAFDNYEVIIVNDCCKKQDDFFKHLEKQDSSAMISMIHMSVKQGVELGLMAGLDASIGDFVFEFDSTLFDVDKDLLKKVFAKSQEGNDIVSVETTANSFSRRLFYKIFNKYSYADYDINASAFRLVSRRAINRVLALGMNCEFRQAVYASCGLKNARIEFEGQANKRKARGLDLAIDSFILYTDLPVKITTKCGIQFFINLIASIILGIFVIVSDATWAKVLIAFLILLGIGDMLICAIELVFYGRLIIKSNNGNTYLLEGTDKIRKEGKGATE